MSVDSAGASTYEGTFNGKATVLTIDRKRNARGRRLALILACGWLVACVVAALAAARAEAGPPPPGVPFSITSFETKVVDAGDQELTTASAHPQEARANFGLEKYLNPDYSTGDFDAYWPIEDMKNVITDLPPGFTGNPLTADRCPVDLVPVQVGIPPKCPESTAVGVMKVYGGFPVNAAVYNVEPERGYPAEFGFSTLSFTYFLYPELRSDGDFGVRIRVNDAPYNANTGVDVKFCRNGAHNYGSLFDADWRCLPEDLSKPPFLTNPASECTDQAPVTTLSVDTWVNPGVFHTREAVSPLITDCDTLEFEPSVDIAPTTTAPDAPTGLNVEMEFPQEDNEHGQAPPALKKAVVTLPEGMSINPSAAGGLEACADDQLMLKSKDPMTCPDGSKIGSVTATSPLLEEAVEGGVYIRSQNSMDPESGEMFRLALVLQNEERGIDVRLPGQVRVNKDTGRIETTFDNNPELPVSSINLTLKDGPRAPLATPASCGEKTIDTTLTSWGKQSVTRQSTFTVDCAAGLGAFTPGFVAGAERPIAGGFSPFNVKIDRQDGQDVLAGVKVDMPTGLLAKVKGNLGAQIGEVDVAAGPGSQPFWLKGRVYLEGAYGDAPYSLRVVVPAKAGPFDLGDVTVKQKVYVDPVTAQVSVVSDPVPIVVKGVPVRLRTLNVSIDKAGFMVNPTSCAVKQVGGTLSSAANHNAPIASRFQVGNCAALPFTPKLALRLTGKKQVTTGKHPGVRAQVNQTGLGEAGIKKAVVRLPKSIALDPENAQALCEFDAGTKPDLENHCPKGSIVGRARASTPLLERELSGNVYFVKNVRKDPKTGNTIRTLPMIVVALRGEISINLKGESSTTRGGKLVNTFNNVPDAPISQFNLNIAGGKNGILAVTRTRRSKINVCASRQIAEADMGGQNGRRHDVDVRIKTPCAKSAKKTKKAGRAKKK
jgi:hypothetical protein